jgi:hypothetical protein
MESFSPKTALFVPSSLTRNLLFEVCSSLVAVLISKELKHKEFVFCTTFPFFTFPQEKFSALLSTVHLRSKQFEQKQSESQWKASLLHCASLNQPQKKKSLLLAARKIDRMAALR